MVQVRETMVTPCLTKVLSVPDFFKHFSGWLITTVILDSPLLFINLDY